MSDDKEYAYKYCHCSRHETRHEIVERTGTDVRGAYFFYVFICEECGNERD